MNIIRREEKLFLQNEAATVQRHAQKSAAKSAEVKEPPQKSIMPESK